MGVILEEQDYVGALIDALSQMLYNEPNFVKWSHFWKWLAKLMI